MNVVVVPYDPPWLPRIACSGCGCEIGAMNGEVYIGNRIGQVTHPLALEEPPLHRDDDCECRCHDVWKILRRVPA